MDSDSYFSERPQYAVVTDIQSDKPTLEEHVNDVSMFLINIDPEEVSQCFWYLDHVGISGEFSNPPEFYLESVDD